MRLAWITDIHLNFVKLEDRNRFYATIRAASPDAVLIGGDIAEAPTFQGYLREMQRAFQTPVYFVLGNHDFYRSSIPDVTASLRGLDIPKATWLTHSDVQLVTDKTALIGDDGWADGRFGNHTYSPIYLNDYELINEFVGLDKSGRLRLLNALGDAAAKRLKAKLEEACVLRKRILMLTHVPPFREACWHEGHISDDNWLPHFACKAMGEAMLEVMDEQPECELTVLCGHTHGQGIAHPRPNVVVHSAGAVYGRPALQQILEA